MNEERVRKIKSELVLRGVKQIDIARKLGIKLPSVSAVISGRKKSRRVVATLIEAGVPRELFS